MVVADFGYCSCARLQNVSKYKASAVPILLLWSLASPCAAFSVLYSALTTERVVIHSSRHQTSGGGGKKMSCESHPSPVFFFFVFFVWPFLYCSNTGEVPIPTQIHRDFAITGDTLPKNKGVSWRIIFEKKGKFRQKFETLSP
jgi:hypothetical protein